ncbi:DapH/DapD/GlmU-related protein [Rheinheimera sp.]|uniref:acyltransferase n=1 Tax=Rheinheimera sp. TaxID=1869214 RepID=UPI0027362F3D|nr:acyltransferase [Rheinheimera sp.]MDP2715677.1 acyltransferase [Rheinheimera sp.]
MKKIIKYLIRKFYTSKAKRIVAQYGESLRVNRNSIFTFNTIIGNNCHFNGMNVLGGGKVLFGDNFHSGPGCMIITSYHNYHGDSIPYDATFINKDVLIGDNVWIGARVIILGGVTIGEGAIVQAGSVVVNDIPALSIAGGHPAKVFSHRDPEHYSEKKSLKKFH